MFAARKQRTIIAEGFMIVGSVACEGVVEVYGKIEGEINCTSLIITRKGHIVGSIKAENITVDGTVDGPIECGDAVFSSQANVVGDVECRTLIVEKGAFIEGSLRLLTGGQHDGSTPEPSSARCLPIYKAERILAGAKLDPFGRADCRSAAPVRKSRSARGWGAAFLAEPANAQSRELLRPVHLTSRHPHCATIA